MPNELTVREPDAIARPQSFEEMLRMAGAMVKSGFLPEAVKTPEQALAIMVAGREIGLGAMQAFRELYVVHGQVGMSTRLIAALFKQNGGSYRFLETTPDVCTVELRLRDGSIYTHTLTRKEADAQNLSRSWEKDKDENGKPLNNGKGQWKTKPMWINNPTGMLRNNDLKQGIRLYDPECVMGILGSVHMPDAETVDAQVVEAPVVEVVIPQEREVRTRGSYDPGEPAPEDLDATPARVLRNPTEWAKGVIIPSQDGKTSKHWYLWKEYNARFWAWAEKRTYTPTELCRILEIEKPDDIATLNLTMAEIVDVIDTAIANREPEPSELLM